MSRKILSFLLASIVFAGATRRVEGCCMVPATYRGTISQSAQEALLIHADGREELVLRINYEIDGGKAGGAMPDRFAWIITVPAEPDAYNVADAKLFEELFDYAEKVLRVPKKSEGAAVDSRSVSGAAPLGVELGKRAVVGPYDIQPVRALGRDALAGLNRWLAANGFPTEDPKHMAYFVDNGFTFLCVKVRPGKGEKAVAGGGELPPLQLSFASEHPYYPLKFSSRQGVFDLNLYLLSSTPFDYEKSAANLGRVAWDRRSYRKNLEVKPKWFPKTLGKVLEKGRIDAKRAAWRLNLIRARNVNRGDTIASWKADMFLATEKKVASLGRIAPIAFACGGALLVCAFVLVARRGSRRRPCITDVDCITDAEPGSSEASRS